MQSNKGITNYNWGDLGLIIHRTSASIIVNLKNLTVLQNIHCV